ncbi:solute carrier family 24 (sodium/potassium/calcium exchanger), member 5 [Sarotherodon galilaeus]
MNELQILRLLRIFVTQMADPGSQPPAETSSPPPARSSDAGLRDFDASLDPETELMFLQVSGKRTMLLSNEARREVAKQARAVKEERRAALDARHKYLMSRLADAGSLEEAAVEDAMVSDDRFSLIHEFFAANGSKKLIFFYQDVKQSLSSRQSSSVDASNSAVAQRKLFLTTGNSEVGFDFSLKFNQVGEQTI